MFTGTLFPKQKPSAEFIVNKRRALLAAEQGFGKTIVSAAGAELLRDKRGVERILVVCPSALTWQWKDKLETFTDATILEVVAKDKGTRQIYGDPEFAYTVCGWHIYRNDFDSIVDAGWDVFIADEAQEFSNNRSKTHKLILRHNRANPVDYRWALTGTAISKRLEQLYSIMYWVDKGFLPPWPEFEKTHIKRHPKFKTIQGYKNLRPLHKHMKHKMDRKTLKDLGDQVPELMPPIVYKVPQSDEYKKAEVELIDALDEMTEDLTFDDQGNYTRAARNPRVSRALGAAWSACVESRDKMALFLQRCESILSENGENRVVGFCFNKDPLYNLQAELALVGVSGNAVRFTGDEDNDQKREAIEAFKDASRVLLCSNAGASGLDLPMANYVVHVDVPRSHGIRDQRNKRITRAGSPFKTAVVNQLMVEDSIEEFFYQVVLQEEKLAKAVLEGGEDEITVKPNTLRQFLKNERRTTQADSTISPAR